MLLLAGTREARMLAARLARDPRLEVIASLAGATRAPEPYEVATRHGGFCGVLGLTQYIDNNEIEAVIDATHPHSGVMPYRAHSLCAGLRLPYLRLARPGWTPGPGDRWCYVDDAQAAAGVIAPGARVFLATGARSLPGFAPLAVGRHLVVRVIDPPKDPFPFPDGEWLVGRPPFAVADEKRRFVDLRIDVLVAKDAGGATDAKLVAARELGLDVVLLRRPPPPPGDQVSTVEEAVDWLERLQ